MPNSLLKKDDDSLKNNNCNHNRQKLNQALTKLIKYLILFTPQQPSLAGTRINIFILR